MKVLSDFDGVMTDQTEEGLFELKLFRDKLVEHNAADESLVDTLIRRAQIELETNPTEHGWWSNGRVAAYADEDLFIRVIGTSVCLDHWAQDGDEASAKILRGLKGHFASFEDVSNWAYGAMVQHTRSGDMVPMDPVVGDVLRHLLARKIDVVVVSNSATDRVIELLETVGLKPHAHTDDPSAQLRVRGDARKFELADEPLSFELNGFRFDVARPHFHKIITEERPDVAIGDVFSLDLALPLYLSRHEPDFLNIHLLLRTRHYTPEWSKAICTRTDEPNAGMGLLDEFADLPGLIGVA